MEPSSPLQPNGSPLPAARRIDDIQPPRPYSAVPQAVPQAQQPAPPSSPPTDPAQSPYYQETAAPVPTPPQPINTQDFFQPSLNVPVEPTPPVQPAAVYSQPATTIPSQSPPVMSQDQGNVAQETMVAQTPITPMAPIASSFDKVSIPEPLDMKKGNSSGLIKRLLIVLVGLIFLAGIGFGAFYFISHLSTGPTKLSTSDLHTVQQNGFSYSVPKTWVNATDKLSLLKNNISSSGLADSITIYADSLRKTSDGKYNPKYAYLFSGSSNQGTSYSVSEFQSTILSSPKLKETFQQTLSSQFSADTLKSFAGSICTQVSNFNSSSIFSTPTNFEILLTLNGDCILSATDAKNYGTPQIHIALEVGFTENNVDLLSLAAFKQSWDLNQNVYNTMLSSFKGN